MMKMNEITIEYLKKNCVAEKDRNDIVYLVIDENVKQLEREGFLVKSERYPGTGRKQGYLVVENKNVHDRLAEIQLNDIPKNAWGRNVIILLTLIGILITVWTKIKKIW